MTTPKKKKVVRRKQNAAMAQSARPKHKHILRLFVAGATVRSSQAVLRVRELCATELKDGGNLEVIDIYQQPALARANQIVATPTLIIELPRPVRRFIGNLSNTSGLFVPPATDTPGKTAA